MRAAVGMLLTFGVALLPDPAAAQSDSDEQRARQHFNAGRSYYEQARYEDAAREFREAYELSERPHLLKNVATALEHAGRHGDAVDALKRYLDESEQPDDRRTVERRIAQLRELQNERQAAEKEAAEPSEDGAADGSHARQSGTDPQADPPDSSRGGAPDAPSRVAPLTWLGSGAALGVVALGTGLAAHQRHGDLQSACEGSVCPAEAKSDRDRGKRLAVTSTVFTGLAVAAGAVGGVLFFTGNDDESSGSAQAHVEIAPGPGAVGATTTVRF